MKTYQLPEIAIERDRDKCIDCGVCVRQCAFDCHAIDEEGEVYTPNEEKCAGCQRCVTLCPTNALSIKRIDQDAKGNANWTAETLRHIWKQAETGGVLLTGMGNPKPYPIYWDHLLLNASQVTNPSIDPLREPMELRTYLGSKPDNIEIEMVNGEPVLKTEMRPNLLMKVPLLFSAMSFGAISHNATLALAMASKELGTYWNTGEGGLNKSLYQYGPNTIVQVASGRFGVHSEYLDTAAAIEIKIGQGAKPGIGGHLPGEKVGRRVSETRMIPKGSDAISPAPHHDIYSIEDLSQLIFSLKEATEYTKPISVKISAVHNVAAIASGIARAGADIIAIDGFRGGTGSAPVVFRDNVGIPIELAIAAVDARLREEGIRNKASVIAAGGFRNSADVIKAIALGADAVYLGTSALVAMGCHVCQKCYTGKCNWGIATQDPYLEKRLNPEVAAERLYNLVRGWSHEISEMLGGMGVNAVESLRGNRLHLRAVGLSKEEMDVLDVQVAGSPMA
jgi:glutamate synthase domain-containing protein 2